MNFHRLKDKGSQSFKYHVRYLLLMYHLFTKYSSFLYPIIKNLNLTTYVPASTEILK